MLYEKSLNPLFIDIIRLSHSQASGKTLLRDICLQMLLKMRMARIKSACPQMLSVPRGAVPSWLSLFPKEIGRDQEAIVFQNDNLYVVIRTDFPKKRSSGNGRQVQRLSSEDSRPRSAEKRTHVSLLKI